MFVQQDWIMRQIEMMISTILRLAGIELSQEAALPEELGTGVPLPGVVELDIFQRVDVAGNIALAARLEDDDVVVPHVVEDALPGGGALGADEEGGGDEAPPVPQEHGLHGAQKGLAGAGGGFDDLDGLMGLQIQGPAAAMEFIAGGGDASGGGGGESRG